MADGPPLDVNRLLEPISPDNPAGEYLRWENEYDALITALEEETDAKNQGIYKRDVKKADWHAVIDLGTAILRDKSKDLQVAAWVAEGLAQTRGLAGLRDGLHLVAALQDAFWATAHPEAGDLELRLGVYEYLDDEKRLPLLLRKTIVTEVRGGNRFPFLSHGESRRFEQEYIRKQTNKKAEEEDAETYLASYLADDKPRAEMFDKAVASTETAFYETLEANLNECKQALERLNRSIRQGYDLVLLAPVNAVRDIPSRGEGQVVVADVDGVLHFRIFDVDGTKVADTHEERLTEQAGPIEDLRQRLETLWPPHKLVDGERDGVLRGVMALLGQSPPERHYGREGTRLSHTEKALDEVIKLVARFLEQKNPGRPAATTEAGTETQGSAAEGGDGGNEDETAVEDRAAGAAREPVAQQQTGRRVTGGEISDPDDALGRIVEAAGFLRTADPADPTPYLVVRALRAGALYRQPKPLAAANLPRPDGNDREELVRLATTSEAGRDLLAAAEQALARPESGAWLDVYRYAITALAGLGYQDAERAALAQLHSILRDFPEWLTAELRDGTPSASSQTRSWLEEQFPDTLGRPEVAFTPPPAAFEPEASCAGDRSDTTERPRDPWDLALECVHNRQPHQAVALLARAGRDARTGRERFHRTLQQAELCLLLERQAIAAPLLEGLARQIDELHLDQWEEPALCARVLVAHYRCLQSQKDSRAEAVYRRLCQLDTALALTLDEAAGG